jgi:hypothetical protein
MMKPMSEKTLKLQMDECGNAYTTKTTTTSLLHPCVTTL